MLIGQDTVYIVVLLLLQEIDPERQDNSGGGDSEEPYVNNTEVSNTKNLMYVSSRNGVSVSLPQIADANSGHLVCCFLDFSSRFLKNLYTLINLLIDKLIN